MSDYSESESGGGSDFDMRDDADSEEDYLDVEGDGGSESDSERTKQRSTRPATSYSGPTVKDTPEKPRSDSKVQDNYTSPSAAKAKHPHGAPPKQYQPNSNTLLGRVFKGPSLFDHFKYNGGASSATSTKSGGKRARPDHGDPNDYDAETWVETRPEKRQKLADDSEDSDAEVMQDLQGTPKKSHVRLMKDSDRSKPAELASLFSKSPLGGRTIQKRTHYSSAAAPVAKKRPSRRSRSEDSSDDSMADFIASDDEVEIVTSRSRRRGGGNAAYSLPSESEEEEEDFRASRAKKAASRGGRRAPQLQAVGRRLRKASQPKDSVEILNLLSSDEEEEEEEKRAAKPAVVLNAEEEEAEDVIELANAESSEQEQESEEEEEADEESIAVLDSIIEKTENYTEKLRARLAEMNISDKRTSIENSEGGKFEKQPEMLQHHLKDYQLVGINWMYLLQQEKLNGILADEMGLGKTIQSIALVSLMFEKGDYGPYLVVVPASTLSNWEREFTRWAPKINVAQYYGTQNERMAIQDELLRQRRYHTAGEYNPSMANVILTTYQMATRKADVSFFRKFNFSYMILDEAQNIKNQGSQRYKNLKKLNTKNRLLLTGTPLQNNLEELWSLLLFLMPKLFGAIDFKTVTSQITRLKRYNPAAAKRVESQYVHRMKRCLGPFILRRLKSQIGIHLKPKITEVLDCQLTESQAQIYKQIFNRSRAAFMQQQQESIQNGNGEISLANFLQNVLMQLRKTANHPTLVRAFYTEDQILEIAKKLKAWHPNWAGEKLEHVLEDVGIMSDFQIHSMALHHSYLAEYKLNHEQLFSSSGKFRLLENLLPRLIDNGHRVLLFSQMTRMLDILEPFMEFLDFKYVRLDGQTPVAERQSLIDSFNNDTEIKVFLLSTRAGGLGINLTSADVAIFYDIAFNPQVDRQAEDRCHRLGQEKDVKIFKLIVKNSCEEQIFEMAKEKHELNDVVLGEGKYAAAAIEDDDADSRSTGTSAAAEDVEAIDSDSLKTFMNGLFTE